MRSIFTILFSVFLVQMVSAQWKQTVTPPQPIECGETILYGNTWGKGDDFRAPDFSDCLSEDNTKTYRGEDVTYEFEVEVESDIRVTITSMCAKGAFLMMDKGDGFLKCLVAEEFDPLIDGGRKSFLGPVRLYPGTYFLVIDSPSEDDCETYSVFLECTPYRPFTICELGGAPIVCGQTISSTIPPAREVITPLGTPPLAIQPFMPCVADQSFQIYQAYFENPGTITATLSNAPPGTSALIYTRDCACFSDFLCLDGADCAANEFGTGQLVNAPSGFYYIIVTGNAGANFDLQVVTNDCICDFEAVPLPLDTTVNDFAARRPNKFDNVLGQGQNAYENCYSGERTYTGGDRVFRIEVDVTSRVTITLNSAFEAGLFLFDDHCTDDCIAMDETFGLNGNAQIREFLLAPGVYHIVVDLATPHPTDWGFELTIKTDPVLNAIVGNQSTVTNSTHTIKVPANLPLDGTQLQNNESITFHATAGNTCGTIFISNATISNSESTINVFGNTGGDNKNGYGIGELFQVKVSNVVGFVDAVFNTPLLPPRTEKNKFVMGESSNLIRLSTNTTDSRVPQNIRMHPLDRTLKAEGGTAEYTVFSGTSPENPDLDVDWCATVAIEGDGNTVELSPTLPNNATGTGLLVLNYEPNETDQEKEIRIRLSGTNIGENIFFTLIQAGQNPCEEDTTPPTIIGCPGENGAEIIIPANVTNFNIVAEIIKAAGLTFEDNCTPATELNFKLATNPFSGNNPLEKGGPAKTVNLQVTDKEFSNDNPGNVNSCPITVKIEEDAARISPIAINGASLSAQEGLKVFPNPNNGVFQIEFNTLNNNLGELVIFNTFGQKVKTITSATVGAITVDMQTFSNGIYYLQLKSGTQLMSKKIMLSK